MLLTHWSKRPICVLETTDQCNGLKRSQIDDGLPAGPKTSVKYVAVGRGVSTGKASFHVDKARSLSLCEAADKWVGRS